MTVSSISELNSIVTSSPSSSIVLGREYYHFEADFSLMQGMSYGDSIEELKYGGLLTLSPSR